MSGRTKTAVKYLKPVMKAMSAAVTRRAPVLLGESSGLMIKAQLPMFLTAAV